MALASDLSPAAQAVLDAFSNASDGEYVEGVWVVNERTMLAAALRAAADQVVPEERKECECFTNEAIRLSRMGVRAEFLAIAAELETSTTENR